MRKPLLVLGLLAVAAVSIAATRREDVPKWLNGIEVGPNSAKTAVVKRITYGTVDYDFGALGGTSAALDTLTAVSGSVTVTGARFGDVCWVGIDQAPVSSFITFNARVTAADTAVVQANASGLTDGGTANQPDSGYTVMCLGRGT